MTEQNPPPTWGPPPQQPNQHNPYQYPYQYHQPTWPVQQMQPTWPAPVPPRPPRRKLWAVLASTVTAMALVGGALYATMGSSASSGPAQERSPFYGAMVALAETPMIGYQTSMDDGAISLNAVVTSQDEMTGTVQLDGEQFGILVVGGKTYVKPPADLLAADTGQDPVAGAVKGKWITGGAAEEELGTATSSLDTPVKLAQQMLAALNDSGTVWPTTETKATTVDGMPALTATTSAGQIVVSRDMPYQVLKMVPASSASASTSVNPTSFASIPAMAQLADDAAAGTLTSNGETDFSKSFGKNYIDSEIAQMENQFKDAKNAVNADITVTKQGSLAESCGGSGCKLTATVSVSASSSSAKTQIEGGTVTAEMDAQVEINGTPAGDCEGSGTLPVDGSGTLECFDAAAGPVFEEQEAQAKAQAQAESEAEGGAEVQYEVDYTGEAFVTAVVELQVAELVQQVQQEQQADDAAPDPYAVSSPSGQVEVPVQPSEDTTPGATTTPGVEEVPEPDTSVQQQLPSYEQDPYVSMNPYEPVPYVPFDSVPDTTTSTTPQSEPAAAPTEATPQPQPTEPEKPCADSTKPAGANRMGGSWIMNTTGANGRAEIGYACLATPLAPGPSLPKTLYPTGWSDAVDQVQAQTHYSRAAAQNMLDRCHIIAKEFGGPATAANLVPCWNDLNNNQNGVPGFSSFEDQVQTAVTANPDCGTYYSVDPLYKTSSSTVPYAFFLKAQTICPGGRLAFIDSSFFNDSDYFSKGKPVTFKLQ